MKYYLEKAGGRKYILTVFLILLFSVFVILNKMTVDQFIVIIPIIAGSYLASNVVQKFSE